MFMKKGPLLCPSDQGRGGEGEKSQNPRKRLADKERILLSGQKRKSPSAGGGEEGFFGRQKKGVIL